MNYYRRYPAAYARDTAHLTLAEHGAYTLLLDLQYETERPLPADLTRLYRICRVRTAIEAAAVRTVIDQFFPLEGPTHRSNPRAASQIPQERELLDKFIGKAKRAAAARWDASSNASSITPSIIQVSALHAPSNAQAMLKQCRFSLSLSKDKAKEKREIARNARAHARGARKLPKIGIPPDFGISPALRDWAAERSFDRLEAHLEAFKEKCKAHDYRYANWESAFKAAIRGDWAGLNGRAVAAGLVPEEKKEWVDAEGRRHRAFGLQRHEEK